MASYMIVNTNNGGYFLGDNTTNPAVGDTILMAPLNYQNPSGSGTDTQFSALWNIVPVLGGNQIQLASNPELCLDIVGPLQNGAGLTLSLSSGNGNFHNSHLWNVGNLPGTNDQIASMANAEFVLDAGSNPGSKVYQDANNEWQTWQCVEIK